MSDNKNLLKNVGIESKEITIIDPIKKDPARIGPEINEEENKYEKILNFEVEKLKRNSTYKKAYPLMEEISLILDFENRSKMEKYFATEASDDEKKAFSKYKTGLIASLSIDKDFKRGIIGQYNLSIDDIDIPPVAITFNYKIETLRELFTNLADNTVKQKDRLIKEKIANMGSNESVEKLEEIKSMEEEVEGEFKNDY